LAEAAAAFHLAFSKTISLGAPSVSSSISTGSTSKSIPSASSSALR
jgi:hypothetical protein